MWHYVIENNKTCPYSCWAVTNEQCMNFLWLELSDFLLCVCVCVTLCLCVWLTVWLFVLMPICLSDCVRVCVCVRVAGSAYVCAHTMVCSSISEHKEGCSKRVLDRVCVCVCVLFCLHVTTCQCDQLCLCIIMLRFFLTMDFNCEYKYYTYKQFKAW